MQRDAQRFNPQAGIAIGPILFIIAILAILAAAIAAGSGSFTANTTSESSKTQSSALIQIGENLKVGMDRIVMEGGVSPSSVLIDPTLISLNTHLFSPTGGGVTAPSAAMAATPGTDVWHYVAGPVSGFSASNADIFAVLKVSAATCADINGRTTGTTAVPSGADLGDFEAAPGSVGVPVTTTSTQTVTHWATQSAPSLTGVATGCVNNTNSTHSGTYFYQILAVQ